MIRLPVLTLALCIAVTTGCAHTITFRSDPPGADVYVDGAQIGQTPLSWEEPLGEEGAYEVEVRNGAQLERFSIKKEGWSVPTTAAVGGACLGGALGLGVLGGVFWVTSIALALPTFGLSLLLAPVGFVALVVAALGFWPAVAATGAVSYLFGRIGPDVVFIDFAARKVVAQPAALIGPPLAPPRARRDEPIPPEIPSELPAGPPPFGY